MKAAAGTRAGYGGSLAVGFRDVLFLFVAVAVVGGTIFLTVWRGVAFIDLGYEIRQLERREAELVDINRELEIERAMLSSPERIESIAVNRLGLIAPEQGQIRVVK